MHKENRRDYVAPIKNKKYIQLNNFVIKQTNIMNQS